MPVMTFSYNHVIQGRRLVLFRSQHLQFRKNHLTAYRLPLPISESHEIHPRARMICAL